MKFLIFVVSLTLLVLFFISTGTLETKEIVLYTLGGLIGYSCRAMQELIGSYGEGV